MARAKRTDRTDARRRNRAQQAAAPDGVSDGEGLARPAGSGSPAANRRTGAARPIAIIGDTPAAGPRPVRPSFMGSARRAYHPPEIREDLAVLPRLLVHWSVLVSAALAVVGTALLLIGSGSGSSGTQTSTTTVGYIGSILVSLFVGPPPFGAALLIGFLLPRGTYLVGAVFGVLASLCLTVFILAQPADKLTGLAPDSIVYAWVLGIVGTMFFSAGMAWYKRFLDLLNPNRGQRAKQQQKPQQGRGNAPRNRLSGSSR